MNKLDNLELMTAPDVSDRPVQLSIPLPVKSEPVLTGLQKKQRANFEAVCLQLRHEASIYLAIVQARFPEADYTQLKDVTTAHLRACRLEYEQHPFVPSGPCPVPHPEIEVGWEGED